MLDLDDSYPEHSLKKMDKEKVAEVREAFESCTYNDPDISSKLCPIFAWTFHRTVERDDQASRRS